MKRNFYLMKLLNEKIYSNTMLSPFYFLAYYSDHRSRMYHIHWYSFKKFLSTGTIRRLALRYLLLLANPFLLILLSILYIRKFGATIAKQYEISQRTLLGETIFLSLFRNVMPLDYYRYQLYLPENKFHINDWIFGQEARILFPSLNTSFTLESVDDKTQFYAICKEHDLCIPTVYEVIDHKTSLLTLPQQDFIVKPARGSKGEGIELWRYKENDRYSSEQGGELNTREVINHLKKKMNNHNDTIILQQRIRNHKTLERFSRGALVMVRVVTLRESNHDIVHLMSVLILPVGEQMLRSQVILSPINEQTGKLGMATNYGVFVNTFINHPDTKEQIVGFKVPYWEEIIAMTTKAHLHFLGYMSLGWDVAITDQGPVIIEANQGWDVETMQKPHHMPLGKTIFAEGCSKNMI